MIEYCNFFLILYYINGTLTNLIICQVNNLAETNRTHLEFVDS